MKKPFAVAVIVLTAMMFLAGCGKEEQEVRGVEQMKKGDTVSVHVTSIIKEKLSMEKKFSGSLEGEEQATVISQLAERVVSVPYKVGSYVGAGTVLVYLDKGGVTSQYNQAYAQLKNVETNLERMRSLYKAGAVAKAQLDDVQTGYDVAKANFDAAKRSVEITAPISGTITESKINAGDFTAPGVPLMTIAQMNSLKSIFSIGEADVPYLKLGQNITVYSDVNPSVTTTARITEIAKSAETATRTFTVKANFRNINQQWFKPGMFISAILRLDSPVESMVLPKESVTYGESGASVMIVKDGKAHRVPVTVGLQNDSIVEIVAGLEEGQTIVTSGANLLKEGTPVRILSK